MDSKEHYLAYPHVIFENDFKRLCEDKGYNVIDISYHHNCEQSTMWKLRNNISPVSLSIRLSPDLIVYKGNDSKFYELKTGNAKDIMRMEAYQLMLNQIRETHFKTPCIYVYRGKFSNYKMIACHSTDIVPQTLVIPDLKKNSQIKLILSDYFECEKIVRKVSPNFSGDAYVEITNTDKWLPVEEYLK